MALPLPPNLIKPKKKVIKSNKKLKSIEQEIDELQRQFEEIDRKEIYRKDEKIKQKRDDIEAELLEKKEKLKKIKKDKKKLTPYQEFVKENMKKGHSLKKVAEMWKNKRKGVEKQIEEIAIKKKAKYEKVMAGEERPGKAYPGQPRVTQQQRKQVEDEILYTAMRKLRLKNIKLN